MAEPLAPRDMPRLNLVHSNDAQPAAHAAPQGPRVPARVGFDRRELGAILDVYGRQVAAGEWRDYAMDFLRERAVFSIYRHHSERPLYVVEKNPKLRSRQGQYMVLAQDGRVLKRGHDLRTVLRVLEPRLSVVTG